MLSNIGLSKKWFKKVKVLIFLVYQDEKNNAYLICLHGPHLISKKKANM